MPTRSTKLGSISPAAGISTTLLTVPSGMTYIVKSAHIYNNAAVASAVSVSAIDSTGVFVVPLSGAALPAGTNGEWNGWLLLVPGDRILVSSSVASCFFWLSGAKLFGTA